jgi:hypothetical protein
MAQLYEKGFCGFTQETLKWITRKIKHNDKFNGVTDALTVWSIDDVSCEGENPINNHEMLMLKTPWMSNPSMAKKTDRKLLSSVQ